MQLEEAKKILNVNGYIIEKALPKYKQFELHFKERFKEISDQVKEILKNNGYLLEDISFYQCKDFPFYQNRYCIMEGKIVNKGKGETRTFAEIAKDFKTTADKQFDIIFTKVTLDDVGYPHFKVVCRKSEEEIRATYNFLASRTYKIVLDGISFCYKATTDSDGNEDYIATCDKRIGPEICNYSVSKVLAEYNKLMDLE